MIYIPAFPIVPYSMTSDRLKLYLNRPHNVR